MFEFFFYKPTNLPSTFLYNIIITAHKETKIWYTEVFPHLEKGALRILVLLAAYIIAVSAACELSCTRQCLWSNKENWLHTCCKQCLAPAYGN